MIPERRVPVHPGIVLQEEFLGPMGLSQSRLAEHIGMSRRQVGEVVRGARAVNPEVAWLLSQALGTSPEFWMNLQAAHDLAKAIPTRRIRRLPRVV